MIQKNSIMVWIYTRVVFTYCYHTFFNIYIFANIL